jgi:hypothetical protein
MTECNMKYTFNTLRKYCTRLLEEHSLNKSVSKLKANHWKIYSQQNTREITPLRVIESKLPDAPNIIQPIIFSVKGISIDDKRAAYKYIPDTVHVRKPTFASYESMTHNIMSKEYYFQHYIRKGYYLTHSSPVEMDALQNYVSSFTRVNLENPNLWVGQDTGVHFHRDWADSILVHLYGTKVIKLVHPIYEKNKIWDWEKVHQYLDSCNLDYDFIWSNHFDNYCRENGIIYYNITLKSNDALIIPKGWWHSTRNLELGLSVNWFANIWDGNPPIYNRS